jgi:DNA-binding MarR family transcriptional regulator
MPATAGRTDDSIGGCFTSPDEGAHRELVSDWWQWKGWPSMGSSDEHISLKNLPSYEELRSRSARYPDTNSPAVEAILTLFRVSADTLAAADAYFARINMSAGRVNVMAILNRNPSDPLSPSTLAERAGVTRATMTGLLERLERDRMIKRSLDRLDRRKGSVLLTAKGQNFLNKVMPDYYDRIAKVMDGLSPMEQQRLTGVLYRIRQRIGAVNAAPGPAAASGGNNESPAQ